jgi:predicted RecB family nuclease
MMAKFLSASSFRSLLHCPHALFLDHHGNATLKSELGEFEQFLLDEGKRYEQEVLSGQEFVQPEYPEGDLDAGAEATLQLLKCGTPLIYQGVLKSDRFVGLPDLLIKKEGESGFGDWYYEPSEIKTSKAIKPFHVLQVCFYAMLLEQVQQRRPEVATVVLAEGLEEAVDMAEAWSVFENQLQRATAIVDRQSPTDLAIFSGCGECVWKDVCYEEAQMRNDVTLVAGLRRAAKPDLSEAGIVTVQDLARADPEILQEFRGIGSKSAPRLVAQAGSQMTGEVKRIGKPKLPKCQMELFYDIEGEPNLDIDYLHGLLIVAQSEEPRYRSFLADNPDDEGVAFGQFVTAVAEILERSPKAPIYHYHSYERTRISKLFERYPDQVLTKNELMDRFIDLHRVLKDSFILPVEGYGLKPVSKWLGFEYRNPKSSATQSMLWYRLWLETGDRQYLDDSVLYNEDDCRATRLIKDWVAKRGSVAAS